MARILRKPSYRQCGLKLFRSYQSKICEILDDSEATLDSLTMDLFSEHIIDKRTKNKVMRDKGYSGAVILMDGVRLKLEQTPMTSKVFEIMHRQEALRSVVKDMQKKKSPAPQLPASSDQDEDHMETLSTSSESGIEYDESKIVSEARVLQDKFQDQLVQLRRQLENVNVEDLQLRLNTHLSCERENTPEIKQVLVEIDQIAEPSKILNHLVRNDMIGYLNYRLLYVFQKLISKSEVDTLIEIYEDAHDRFLRLTDLATLAKIFRNNPELAPLTNVGLPKFMVHLDELWERKSAYQWNVLLNKQFSWPHHIHITRIDRGSIVIVYSVLPFFAPAVVRDLTDPPILSLLERQLGIIKVELTVQLIEMGREEEAEELLEVLTLAISDISEEATTNTDPSLPQELLPVATDHQTVIGELPASSLDIELEVFEDGLTLLHLIAESGSAETVEFLLKSGADIHKEDKLGRTPLHLVTQSGKTDTVDVLLKSGANIHKEDSLKRTPLHLAAESGRTDTAEVLLKYGADIHKEDISRQTPLHLAAKSGRTDTVEVLLKYGADIHKKNSWGRTPLHLVAESGRTDIVEVLLKFGADLLKEDNWGHTPLHLAAESGRTDAVEVLLKYGADNHNETILGFTPLHLAVKSGKTDTVELLLKFGADIEKETLCECTPLHLAVESGRTDTVELLLEYDADIHKKDKWGKIPMDLATESGEVHIVELLQNYGQVSSMINSTSFESSTQPTHSPDTQLQSSSRTLSPNTPSMIASISSLDQSFTYTQLFLNCFLSPAN